MRIFHLIVLAAALALTARSGIVINEIHYDPDIKTELVEFVELHNPEAASADLTGWRFDRGVSFAFPPGTSIPAGGYLVVAQDPAAFQAKFGFAPLGPWQGKLTNKGEELRLVDVAGNTQASVTYGRGFPWPIVGGPPGWSIELVNPGFDPGLGGNWRRSDAGAASATTLVPADATWRYRKGNAEASTPREAWRQPGYDDAAWLTGDLAIGYGEGFLSTTLADMKGNYTSVFNRREFVVDDLALIGNLLLEVIVDDGFNAWINGRHVATFNVPGTNLAFGATANSAIENLDWRSFNVAPGALRLGTNVLCVQFHNASLNGSSDAFLNARLTATPGHVAGPTPGGANSVLLNNLPPRLRQVKHRPKAPTSGQAVTVTAKATDSEDGVATVRLEYQLVDPGQYIHKGDPAYATNWTVVAMNDTGTAGDTLAGDGVFAVVLPASLQQHRRLVRYRVVATDHSGRSIRGPYDHDPEPNFAYFVYDGVPAWSGAARPGVTPVETFDSALMESVPVYHLISRKADVEQSTWFERYRGSDYKWTGTIVHDGEVYDHIKYRARGGVWRYAMGKNMWKFNFHAAHRLAHRDDYGREYEERWDKLNFSALIQQGNYWHRGEQGLFESAGFQLFNLLGVEAPLTNFAHFRIIDEAAETGPSQFDGDFWGLYLAIEQLDGRFLDQHDLPDGNLYKMEKEGGTPTGTLNNQGLTAVTDRSDLNAFLGTYNSTNTLSDQWWRDHLDLPRYYSYRSVVEGIHHYDIGNGKNYFYFLNPETARWQVHPWDLDLTWANNMFGNGNEPFKSRVLTRPVFEQEYQNRLREVRDLLYNNDQGDALLDDIARLVNDPAGGLSFVDADRARWDHNPILDDSVYIDRFSSNKARTGRYYAGNGGSIVPPTPDFEGMVQKLKNYIATRGGWIDANLIFDADIPVTPSLAYTGGPGHPADDLSFESSGFLDNSGTLAALEWRLGEIVDTNAPAHDPAAAPVYEITAVWTSGPVGPALTIDVPPDAVVPGHTYRARVRHRDSTGKCSHWSAPYEFTAGQPAILTNAVDFLRVTELMYHSPAGGDYDYIEFQNTSPDLVIDLSNVAITDGVAFDFPTGTMLAPSGRVVVAKAPGPQFEAYYGIAGVTVLGPYSGNLNNDGERIQVELIGGIEIVDFTYNDGRGWPCGADGAGHSLIPLVTGNQRNGRLDYGGNWRRSRFRKGSPGTADPDPAPVGLRINEFAAHTDFSDPAHPGYDSNDWIEFHNAGGTTVSFDDLYVSDTEELVKWALPAGSLAAGDWIVFDEVSGFHQPITTGFGLNKAGEKIVLTHLPANGPGEVVDCLCFEGQASGETSGRFPDGADDVVRMTATPGARNLPMRYNAAINEIMYHPPTNFEEYIELHNPRAVPVDLFNAEGPWRISGSVDFTFPPGVTLQPGEFALVLTVPPTASNLSAMAAKYGVTLPAQVLGPAEGTLDNRGGRVSLEAPQAPDAAGDPVSWVVMDEVVYADDSPWPESPDGDGDSLHRVAANFDADNPGNWTAGPPTPGTGPPAIVNFPPRIDPAGPFTVDELTTLAFDLSFVDWNVDQGHIFSLGAGAPTGAVLAAGGQFEWVPSEAQGPGVHAIPVVLADDGLPPLDHTIIVTVIVDEVALAPVIQPLTNLVVDEGDTLSHQLVAVDPDGDPVLWSLGAGAPAAMTITTNGLLAWTPAEADGPGTYAVEVIAADPTPLTSTTTVVVHVLEVNRAPLLDAVPTQQAFENQELTLALVATDPDIPTQTLSFALAAGPAGMAVHAAGGAVTWTPAAAQVPMAHTVLVEVVDNGLPPLTDRVSFVVVANEAAAPTNQPPDFVDPAPQQVAEEQLLALQLIATDPDVPTQSLTFAVVAGPTGLTVRADGLLQWTPSEDQGPGVHTASVSVTDSGFLSDQGIVVIEVLEANRAPVFDSVGARSGTEGGEIALVLTAADPDLPTQALSFALLDGPGDVEPGGAYLWTPSEADGPGTFTTRVVVTDGALAATQSIVITVAEDPSPPSLAAIQDLAVVEGATVAFTAEATDPDLPTQAIVYALGPAAPNGASIHPTRGEFTWPTGEPDGPSTRDIDIIATDASGLADTTTVRVTVTDANQPPEIEAISTQGTAEGELLEFQVVASDPDVPTQTLAYALGPEAPSTTNLDPVTGRFSWRPTESDGSGFHEFTVVVTDSGSPSLSATAEVLVVVVEVNDLPDILALPDFLAVPGRRLMVQVVSRDNDSPPQSLTHTLTQAPTGAVMSAAGLFEWTPGEGDIGEHVIGVQVTDSGSPPESAHSTFRIRVIPDPVIVAMGMFGDDQIAIETPASPGVIYALDGATDLQSQDWRELARLAATDDTLSWTDDLPAGAQALRHYRVRALSP